MNNIYKVSFSWYSKVFKQRCSIYNNFINSGTWNKIGYVFTGTKDECREFILYEVADIIQHFKKFRNDENFNISMDSFLYNEPNLELSLWLEGPYNNSAIDIYDYYMYTEHVWRIYESQTQ